ncbi:MAG TPA: hypothetical protein VJR24_01755 [Gemmatimonadaceae bacterium]|nr:hypothetical protein [Gemmatimonadaceae bacterium]
MRCSHRAAGIAFLIAAVAASCNEVGTNPNTPVAIQLDAPASPSVLLGDTLRDSLGRAAPLHVVVFNYKNDSIGGIPVSFLAVDSLGAVTVDQSLGIVVGHQLISGVLVVATAAGLQSIPDTIAVVDTPSVMIAEDSARDSVDFSFAGGLRDTVLTLRVRLLHEPDTVAVPEYAVHYTILHPAPYDNTDSTNVQLVKNSTAAQLVDTTDATGSTNMGLKLTPFTHAFNDSLVVQVSATAPGGLPAGSPVVYVRRINVH